jgi:hypothetical protein
MSRAVQPDWTVRSNAMASAHTPGAVRSQPASTPASATPTPGAVRSQPVPAPASATNTPKAAKSQPAQASGKRKRETDATRGSPAEAEEVVERKYGLDIDLLECPICSEPFSPPVYQVPAFFCHS